MASKYTKDIKEKMISTFEECRSVTVAHRLIRERYDLFLGLWSIRYYCVKHFGRKKFTQMSKYQKPSKYSDDDIQKMIDCFKEEGSTLHASRILKEEYNIEIHRETLHQYMKSHLGEEETEKYKRRWEDKLMRPENERYGHRYTEEQYHQMVACFVETGSPTRAIELAKVKHGFETNMATMRRNAKIALGLEEYQRLLKKKGRNKYPEYMIDEMVKLFEETCSSSGATKLMRQRHGIEMSRATLATHVRIRLGKDKYQAYVNGTLP